MNDSGELTIEIDDDRKAFEPGEFITGQASWRADSIKSAQIRLFWYTGGKGTRDVRIIDSMPVPHPPAAGRTRFSFRLPEEPYSFLGRLISLDWAIELVIEPHDQAARAEFVMAPGGTKVLLDAIEKGA